MWHVRPWWGGLCAPTVFEKHDDYTAHVRPEHPVDCPGDPMELSCCKQTDQVEFVVLLESCLSREHHKR